MPEVLSFRGLITKGVGRFVGLHVPGRAALPQAPPDWPEALEKGSLNVRITHGGYPPEFKSLGLPETVTSLDARRFPPAFEIAQHEFGNNKLQAHPDMPHRGSAQVWRARLVVLDHEIGCWVLRRYGSGLRDQLEIVSHIPLRTTYQLIDGMAVRAHMEVASDAA